MQGLGSLLLFAVFFYFMMRFGCGAHMVHGHHPAPEGPVPGAANDPVCGMPVASGEGYAMMRQGRQYRFCGKKCLDQFEREPPRYLSAGQQSGAGVTQ